MELQIAGHKERGSNYQHEEEFICPNIHSAPLAGRTGAAAVVLHKYNAEETLLLFG